MIGADTEDLQPPVHVTHHRNSAYDAAVRASQHRAVTPASVRHRLPYMPKDPAALHTEELYAAVLVVTHPGRTRNAGIHGRNGLPRLQRSEWASLPTMPEVAVVRSEERRVGKECRSRWSPAHSEGQ